MQLKERRYAVAVRAAHELEGLAFELRWSWVTSKPGNRVHNVLDADQLALVSDWFIDQGFRMRFIDFAVAYQVLSTTCGSFSGESETPRPS